MSEASLDAAAPQSAEEAEAAYERFVWKNLPRNFAGHFIHGMLGMTGFRLFNAPTFLPAYLHMLSGSDLFVGLGQSLQQLGGVVSPVIGATQIEHRKRVLPVAMLMGTLMRVQILGVALAGFFLHGTALLVGRADFPVPAGPVLRAAVGGVSAAAGQGDPHRPARAPAGPAQRHRRGDRRGPGLDRRPLHHPAQPVRQRLRRDLPAGLHSHQPGPDRPSPAHARARAADHSREEPAEGSAARLSHPAHP